MKTTDKKVHQRVSIKIDNGDIINISEIITDNRRRIGGSDKKREG